MNYERATERSGAEVLPQLLKLEGGVCAVLGDSESRPDLIQLAEKVVTYVAAEKLTKKNPTEGDCAHIAGKAVKDLASYFEKKGYGLTLAVTESKNGPIPAYASLGYGHHVITVAEGEDAYVAFDLTAAYTMPELQSDVLFVIATNEPQLRAKLQSLTGSRWEVR